jgi:hypothetical protein
MVATTCTAITCATARSTAEPSSRRAEHRNRGCRLCSGPGRCHPRRPQRQRSARAQRVWLGAETVGQRRCVVSGDRDVLRGRGPRPVVLGGRRRSIGRQVGPAKSLCQVVFRAGARATPMPPLMAPARTKDGADDAHLQPDGLTHGESCFLRLCSRVPRCPTDAGPSFVPLMCDRAERYEAADPLTTTYAASHKEPAQDQTGPMAQAAARWSVRSGQGNSRRRCQVQPGKRQRLGEIYLTLLFGHPPGAHLDHDRPREPLYRKGFE